MALSRVRAHETTRGSYRRLSQGPDARDPYGCADAINLMYTLSALPGTHTGQAATLVSALQSLQDEDGLFRESTHHPYHTTAHCLGALELLDAEPSHRLTALARLKDTDALVRFLDELPWENDPWRASHRGSGIYAALVLANEADDTWQATYFHWLEGEWDERSGLLRRGAIHADDYDRASPDKGRPCLFHDLAGSFHYLFNLLHAGRPMVYAEALVNTCLRIFEARLYPFCERVGFAEIDWVYCLHRAVRQSGHRREESAAALRVMAERHVDFLHAGLSDPARFFDDLHTLFGAFCALAELELALPGTLLADRPLRQVLDRRPFI